MLNIYNIKKSNFVNGRGNRYVIWLQGCNLGCKGCWNRDSWSFEDNILMSCDELFEDIIKQKAIEGVTFSGGEPFLQDEKLSQLAKKIKSQTKLSIYVFSGFRLEEIKESPLLKYIDTLVAGRYGEQQIVYNFDKDIWKFDNESIEVEICENGELVVTGYPSDTFLEDLKNE